MSNATERKHETNKAAKELESGMEGREEIRRRFERETLKNLNQGYEDPVDTKHPGINWGPSYKTRHKKRPRKG